MSVLMCYLTRPKRGPFTMQHCWIWSEFDVQDCKEWLESVREGWVGEGGKKRRKRATKQEERGK